MADGADKDYKFGQKNHWRRWLWNRIAERLSVPAHDAVVLYLAGAEDYDRSVALAHGFKPWNMIAVERDAKAAQKLRHAGVLVIEGDIGEILRDWKFDRHAHVVHADFCGGLEPRTLDVAVLCMLHPAFTKSVLAFNMLRGRDPGTNELRAAIQAKLPQDPGKHRGKILLSGALSLFFEMFGEHRPDLSESDKKDLANFLDSNVNPAFNSYASSTTFFDSVVFNSPLRPVAEAVPLPRDVIASDVRRNAPLRGRIAATLAHRTMRMNANGR